MLLNYASQFWKLPKCSFQKLTIALLVLTIPEGLMTPNIVALRSV